MKEDLINDVMIIATRYMAATQLEKFRNELCVATQPYSVERATQDLAVWSYELPKCFEYYLVTKKIEGKSDETLKLYKLYISQALMAIAKPLEDITANDIRVHLYKIQKERGISDRTLDSRRSCLLSFFGWIAAEGYITKNPMLNIQPIKYERKERQPIEAISMETIRLNCKNLREQAMVEVLYSTACRVTELVRLNKGDVNLSTGEVKLFGKGNKHRTSYLSPRAKLYLMNYLSSRNDESDALFVGERAPHNRLSKRAVENAIRAIGERCGLDHLHPHLFRHTCATDALNKGMPVTQLKSLLGHSSLDTTMIYAKVAQSDVAVSHSKYIY